jgi:hypothetical protein
MALPQDFTLELVEDVNGNYGSVAVPFPLPAAYRMPAAKMPMALVFPRPDAETQTYARHRWAHPSFQYKISIGVQGGNWPFKYELISAPTGATIGSYMVQPNYGTITWDPSASSGTESFTVRVTDNDGSTVDAIWTVTIDATRFIFVDPNAVTSGTGTIASPLKLWTDWYKNDHNDATYAGKILVLRTGDHILYGASGDTPDVYNIQINSAIKPAAIIGIPGESAIVDCTSGKILIQTCTDTFYRDFELKDACQLVDNAHFFWLTTATVSRATFQDLIMRDFDQGLVGTDNANAIFVANTANKNYFMVSGCTFDNFTVLNNGGFIDMYALSYFLIENNIFRNSNVSLGVHAKATVAFGTMRNNDFSEGISGVCMAIGYSASSPSLPHDHEMCWNKFKNTGGVATFRCVELQGYPGQTYNTYAYRNTSYGGCPVIRFVGAENFGIDANFVVSLDPITGVNWNMSIADVTVANFATTDLTAINADMTPTDPTKRFTIGCEAWK